MTYRVGSLVRFREIPDYPRILGVRPSGGKPQYWVFYARRLEGKTWVRTTTGDGSLAVSPTVEVSPGEFGLIVDDEGTYLTILTEGGFFVRTQTDSQRNMCVEPIPTGTRGNHASKEVF